MVFEKLMYNSLYGIQFAGKKLWPSKSQTKKAGKPIFGSFLKSDESFNSRDKDFLAGEDGFVVLCWKNPKVATLLSNFGVHQVGLMLKKVNNEKRWSWNVDAL